MPELRRAERPERRASVPAWAPPGGVAEVTLTEERPFCAVCQEDFPVPENAEVARITMGQLYPLSRWRSDSSFRRKIERARFGIGDHLCGNCWFDLTDDD